MIFYKSLVKPLLFKLDPEQAHDATVRCAALAGRIPPLRSALSAVYSYRDPILETELSGLSLANPVGMAAGWDKSGLAIPLGSSLGFGHYEIGSISAERSLGNPKPRLFRLPDDRAIIVHYGLPNDGAEVVAERLQSLRRHAPLGVNIVNTNRGMDAPPESPDEVLDDYVRSTRLLKNHADYLVYNLSCPNTEAGRGFFSVEGRVRLLLDLLAAETVPCPVFLKVAPKPGTLELDELLKQSIESSLVSGYMLNLPPRGGVKLQVPEEKIRDHPGAIAGKPVEPVINAQLRELASRIDRSRHTIVAAGGVFDAEDAYRKIRLGASAVQIYTALIFEGPAVVGRICDGLAKLLRRDGFSSVAEAVGVDLAK